MPGRSKFAFSSASKRASRSAVDMPEPVNELMASAPKPLMNFCASSGETAARARPTVANRTARLKARKTRRCMASVRLCDLGIGRRFEGHCCHRTFGSLAVLDRVIAVLAIEAAHCGVVIDRALADRVQGIEVACAQIDAFQCRTDVGQLVDIVVREDVAPRIHDGIDTLAREVARVGG